MHENARIEYTEYDGYVGYKVFPPGGNKVALLGVAPTQKDCLLQIEASIALITEAKAKRDAKKPPVTPLSIVDTTAQETPET